MDINEQSIAFLMSLFEEHEITAVPEDNWIVLTDYGLRATCAVSDPNKQPGGFSLQLDVCVETGMGRALVESFAGFGRTVEEALADSWQNFISNSFHVILAAFFTDAHDDQISREIWTIDDEERTVILGNIGGRRSAKLTEKLPLDWFAAFEEKIKERPLGPGSHWIRLFYGQMDDKTLACEVLLDNETWTGVQEEMTNFDWPQRKEFYSVRLFLIVLD